MSVRIGGVHYPNANGPEAGTVSASVGGVEVILSAPIEYEFPNGDRTKKPATLHNLSPIAARNLAALLVRASDECERMRDREGRS